MNKKILCVCYGNSCRSPMIQGFLRDILGKDAIVNSAGFLEETNRPASPHSVTAMEEIGIDISSHSSSLVTDLPLETYDLVITVEAQMAAKLEELGVQREKIRVIEIDNPYQKDLAIYRITRDQIKFELNPILAELQA